MKRLIAVACIAGTASLLAGPAFADAQIVDFRCIWYYMLNRWYDFLYMPAPDVDVQDWTTQTGLGIPDVEEFKLLSLILANPTAPNHDAIHTAFATNASLARTACGSTIIGLCTSNQDTGPGARQPIPNTDPQAYYSADGLLGAFLTMGEWDMYLETIEGFKDSPFGAAVTVPTSSEGYVLRDDLGMCGDVDGDGISNANEYWAASPYAWAAAIDPGTTAAACIWNLWVRCDNVSENGRLAYNAETGRVYFVPVNQLTWAEALDYTVEYAGRLPLSVGLCTIRDAAENTFIDSAVAGDNEVWIGCTDAGRDTGHTSPNPQDWYWLSDPENSMPYANWDTGEPNGVDGAENCGILYYNGTWRSAAEFTGTPPVAARRYAALEVDGTFPDEDANGAPDAFEDKDGDLVPDGFEVTPPEAEFSADPVSGDMPLEVQFTDLSVPGSSAITSWAWDFGDGGTSSDQNPTHTYTTEVSSTTYTVSLTVTTAHGSDTATKTGYITVYYACVYEGRMSGEGAMICELLMSEQTPSPEFKAVLTALGMTTWPAWDIEGIENNFFLGEIVGAGDGLPDAAQVALIEYVACTPTVYAHDVVDAGMSTNKALWEDDLADLATIDPAWSTLLLFSNLYPALIGSSLDMKNSVNAMFFALSGGGTGLPSYADYVVFGQAKASEWFSANGDVDGDGKTNLEEYNEVLAAGGGLEDFADVATDPNNIWPGNPLLPVAGLAGAGALAGGLLASAALILRRKEAKKT